MDRKRSLGVEIYARLEVIIGVLGTIIFLWSLLPTVRELFFEPGYLREMEVLIIYIALFSLPFPFLILFGINMFMLKPFARKANLWLISAYFGMILLVVILIYIYGIMKSEDMNMPFLFYTVFMLGGIIYYNIHFLNHPNIRRQFK